MSEPEIIPPGGPDSSREVVATRLRQVGIAFLVLGAIAVILPTAVSYIASTILAVVLFLWGCVGVALAFSMRPLPEWRVIGLVSALILILGIVFILTPRYGVEFLTFVVAFGILLEGIFSLIAAVRLRPKGPDAFPIWATGIVSLIVGFLILMMWPGQTHWLVGLLLGINFLFTGFGMVMIARTIRKTVN